MFWYSVRNSSSSTVNVYYETSNQTMSTTYEDADLEMIFFSGTPEFDYTGTRMLRQTKMLMSMLSLMASWLRMSLNGMTSPIAGSILPEPLKVLSFPTLSWMSACTMLR